MSRIALVKVAAYSVSCLALLASCSGGKQTESKVSIEIPSAARFASKARGPASQNTCGTVRIRRIMINVKGSGMPLQPRIWQAKGDSDVAPRSFEFEAIPFNTQGTIQVLVVASCDSVEKFYYAREPFKANKPVLEPTIVLSQIAISDVQGNIAGRIVTSGSTLTTQAGPSGKVNIFIHPEAGEEMLVDQSEIFSGWFDFFAMKDIAFSYRMEGQNTAIIPALREFKPEDDRILESTSTDPYSSSQAIRAYIPKGFRGWNGGTREPVEARFQILGFFGRGGPGGFTRYLCFSPNASNPIKDLFVSPTTSSTFLASWLNSTDSYVNRAATTGTGGLLSGRLTSTGVMGTSACSNQDYTFLKTLTFDTTKDSNNGGSGRLGFYAPFITMGSFGEVIAKTVTSGPSGSMVLDWKYLPGVFDTTSGPVQGTQIFARLLAASPAPSSDMKDLRDVENLSDGYDCDKLLSRGFRSVADVTAGTSASNTAFVSTSTLAYAALSSTFSPTTASGVSDAWDDGRLQFVVCPYRSSGGRIYHASSQAVKNQSTGGGTVASGTYIGISAPHSIAAGVCTPVVAYATDSLGVPATILAGETVQVTAISSRFVSGGTGSSAVDFFTDPSCTGGAAISTFSLFQSNYAELFVKTQSGVVGQIRPIFTVDGTPNDGTDMPFNVDTTSISASTGIEIGTNKNMQKDVCHPVLVYASDANRKVGTMAGGRTVSVSAYLAGEPLAAPYVDVLHSLPDCTSTWGTSLKTFTSSSTSHVRWISSSSVFSAGSPASLKIRVQSFTGGAGLADYDQSGFTFYSP